MTRRDLLKRSFAALASSISAAQAEQAAERRLAIGHDNPFEPFAYVEEGSSKGMLIDAVRELLRRAGHAEVVWKPLALDAIEAELASGRIDGLAFKGVSEERRMRMDFSQPLIITGGATFTRRDLKAEADLAAYEGMTVVTPERGPLAAPIRRQYPSIKLLTVASYDEALAVVLDGRADVAALNFQVGQRLVKRKHEGRINIPAAPYAEIPLAFAVAKGRNQALLAGVDRALAEAKADGWFERLYARWLS